MIFNYFSNVSSRKYNLNVVYDSFRYIFRNNSNETDFGIGKEVLVQKRQ